jgi:serine/threonine protein kinase
MSSLSSVISTIAINVGINILTALEAIHEAGYVHCDLKLDNICGIINPETNEYNFVLIDFGLIQKYQSKECHIEKAQLDHFRGNILFAAENAVKLQS